MAMGEMGKARASFEAALDRQLARAPTMLKVAAIYFKIGTLHYHLGEFESALLVPTLCAALFRPLLIVS